MSSLIDLQKKVAEQTKRLAHADDPHIVLLYLVEEVGEAIRAYLKEKGLKEQNNRVTETFKEELGDVFLLLLRLAESTGTDLETVLDRTMDKLDRSKEEHEM